MCECTYVAIRIVRRLDSVCQVNAYCLMVSFGTHQSHLTYYKYALKAGVPLCQQMLLDIQFSCVT